MKKLNRNFGKWNEWNEWNFEIYVSFLQKKIYIQICIFIFNNREMYRNFEKMKWLIFNLEFGIWNI
jgi:hypothetical protein